MAKSSPWDLSHARPLACGARRQGGDAEDPLDRVLRDASRTRSASQRRVITTPEPAALAEDLMRLRFRARQLEGVDPAEAVAQVMRFNHPVFVRRLSLANEAQEGPQPWDMVSQTNSGREQPMTAGAGQLTCPSRAATWPRAGSLASAVAGARRLKGE